MPLKTLGTARSLFKRGGGPSSLLTGLLAWWKLDEATGANRLDSSGNGITLTDVNANLPATTGLIGSAASFTNGQTQWLRNSAALFTSGSFTISLWFNPGSTSVLGYLWQQGQTNTPRQRIWMPNNGTVAFSVNTSTPTSSFAVSTGAWIHVVGRYDGTNQNLYVNGVLQASAAATASFTGLNNITIGALQNGTNTPTTDIDLAGVWSRALTDGSVSVGNTATGEIASLYAAGVGLNYPFS